MSDDKPDPKPDPVEPQPVEPLEPAEPTPMPQPKKPRTPNLALRRLRAGFKPSRGQAIVAVVLALVACMAVVQVRVNRAGMVEASPIASTVYGGVSEL